MPRYPTPNPPERRPAAAVALLGALAFIPAGSGHALPPTFPKAANIAATAAEASFESRIPSDEYLERVGAVFGDVTIWVEDVFDTDSPAENRGLYRAANRLHYNTREEVIRRQLLFRSGDPYSTRRLRESERLLRSHKYLFDCEIRPVRYSAGRVDVEVWVKDVWTLKLGGSFSRSGGVNRTRVELQDSNLLGTGKTVELEWEDSVDRTAVIARYLDRNLLGSRAHLKFFYSDNSDGEELDVSLARPFFSFDTRWAAGIRTEIRDRIDSLYQLGEVSQRFVHQNEFVELFGGLSRGLVEGRARRLTFGLTFREDRFESLSEEPRGEPLPEDRKLIYPWVGLESVQDAFSTAHNQDQLSRTEDILLGTRYRLRLGWSPEALGSDRDRAVFGADVERGLRPAEKQILLLSAASTGRWSSAGVENLLAFGSGRFYWRDLGPHLFFASLDLGFGRNLDGENQILLGGDNGLRGYPLRYQDGDARALLTLEQRVFTGWYPFRLFFIGAAVFFDVGRTWPDERSGENLGWLKDVGVGLRFSSSRSGFGSVVHFDLAFPLDGDTSIDSVQWLITSKQSL